MIGLHRWLLIIISQCQMFQSCRICFGLKFNHEVRMSARLCRSLLAVRQCLVALLRLLWVWLWCQAVRWLPGYLLQWVGCQIWIFLLQGLCHVHYCLWMWCNLRWLLILVGNFYKFFWSSGFSERQGIACCRVICCATVGCDAVCNYAVWSCMSHWGLVTNF